MYREAAVDIVDDNAEDYTRTLKIAYSGPTPNGCFEGTGTFTVTYTVDTPWTSPPFVAARRTVSVEDVN